MDGLPGANMGGRGGLSWLGTYLSLARASGHEGPPREPRNRDSASGQRSVCRGQAPVLSQWSGSDRLCIRSSLVGGLQKPQLPGLSIGRRVRPQGGGELGEGRGVPRLRRAGAEACVTARSSVAQKMGNGVTYP